MHFNSRLNIGLNLFCPYAAIGFLLYISLGYGRLEPYLILGLLYFAQRTAFRVAFYISNIENLTHAVEDASFEDGFSYSWKKENPEVFTEVVNIVGRKLAERNINIEDISSEMLQEEISRLVEYDPELRDIIENKINI